MDCLPTKVENQWLVETSPVVSPVYLCDTVQISFVVLCSVVPLEIVLLGQRTGHLTGSEEVNPPNEI